MSVEIWIGICIPFLGTLLGAGTVYFMKKEVGSRTRKILLGFAAGVMLSASMWSLLSPSVEIAFEQGVPEWLPATVGFVIGTVFMIFADKFFNEKQAEKKGLNTGLLFFSVTVHNIPEGMAVGAVFAGMMSAGADISFASALTLALGIALQNMPEGAIVSMPIRSAGASRTKCFVYGVLSGVVEPLSALFTILFYSLVNPVLPYLLSFAAGAMIYVVARELIPDEYEEGTGESGIIALACGFVVMMIMDIVFG